jgi:hypothetical protein
MAFFRFPEDAPWNPKRKPWSSAWRWVDTTERFGRRPGFLGRPLGAPTTPEKCFATHDPYRTQLERAVEAKVRRRELAEDGHVELTGRDLRRPSQGEKLS